MLFSEATFAFRDLTDKHLFGGYETDGRTMGARLLRKLETPWPNGTTGELLARMIQDVDLRGTLRPGRRRPAGAVAPGLGDDRLRARHRTGAAGSTGR
jgi:hypothetical protein